MAPGTVADGLLERPAQSPCKVVLEHPTGTIDVLIDCCDDSEFDVRSVGLVRTARKLADGNVYIPSSVWRR